MKTSPLDQIQEIRQWIARQVESAGASGAVVGLSGGIDSAVVAALAARALGDNLLAIILPCHSSEQDIQDALLVARHLQLKVEEQDLSAIFDRWLALYPSSDRRIQGNLKSRLRMATLYHVAALRNHLVLGTSNRSEWEIGYFTKYGDSAADLLPIVHLLKSEVRQLAMILDIPKRVIEKPPSAGLWEGQTDEGELGFTYEQLDNYLLGRLSEVPPEVQAAIRDRQRFAAHKKQPAPRLFPAGPPSDGPSLTAGDVSPYDRSIEALTLISGAITSDHYIEDILRLIVMVTAEVMNSSVCSLWLLDEKEGVLRLRATQSINPEYIQDRVLRVGEGIVGKVVVENRPYSIPDVLTDPYYKEKDLARRMGLVSMLSMPMRVKDRVIGVINCYTSYPHVFSELETNILTAVANQAAVAIENTELMVKTKVIQEELEKRKLIERAKDLVMRRLDLSGDEAYRWLQKRSMDTRKSMREVAEAVLLTMEG